MHCDGSGLRRNDAFNIKLHHYVLIKFSQKTSDFTLIIKSSP